MKLGTVRSFANPGRMFIREMKGLASSVTGKRPLSAACELQAAREASPRLAGITASFASCQPRPCSGLLVAACSGGDGKSAGRKEGAAACATGKK